MRWDPPITIKGRVLAKNVGKKIVTFLNNYNKGEYNECLYNKDELKVISSPFLRTI